MVPGVAPVLSCRTAWKVTGEGEEVLAWTLFHSMIRRSGVPSLLVSSYLLSNIAWPLTLVQSSHNTAMARCVGAVVRLVLAAEVLLPPKVIRPLVLTDRLV